MQAVQERLGGPLGSPQIVACSVLMDAVREEIRRTAQTDAGVLIAGEPGTGKGLVAEAIHCGSRRKDGPFVKVNLAAIPETSLEGELFGHVETGYSATGSVRPGRLEAANRGTLFLDDIGDLPLACQSKLLRVLESRAIGPQGAGEGRRIDVRLIAATGRNLERLVAEGRFREDLYFRLNTAVISLPPLRNRREDIPLLVRHFLDEICRAHGRPPVQCEEALLKYLETHDWPGNVTQLRACIESMMARARSSVLTLDDLPEAVRTSRTVSQFRFEMPQGVTLADVVKAAVLQTLDRLDGNRTQTAQALGISVRTLQRKLKQWRATGQIAAAPAADADRYEALIG